MVSRKELLTIPNAVSGLRIVLAPFLLVFAWFDRDTLFIATLATMLVSDIIDGKLARWLNQTSSFGSVLDSVGDLLTYSFVPVCAIWLRPNIVIRELPLFILVVISYALPILIGFARFRRLTSYHTRLAVLSAYLMGASALVVFAWSSTTFFHWALPFLVIEALEEIAITAVLPEWRTNVPSLRHALAIRRAARP